MSWQAVPGRSLRPALAPAMLGVAAAGVILVALLAASLIAGAGGAVTSEASGEGDAAAAPPSGYAIIDIPPRYLALYRAAARRYGLDWAVLAAIGKVECDHGRAPDLSCSRAGAVNGAGAGGPMQFLAATWSQFGVDGDGDGLRDRWDPADAIFGAANYLRASGAPQDYARALFAYNHASSYVAAVLELARRYRASSGTLRSAANAEPASEAALERMSAETATPVRLIAGSVARLQPGEGHVALIPAGVPAVVQAMLVAGNELQDLPYGPAGHPNPLGASEQDCSSTLNYILYRSGVRPLDEITRENPLAQDYVRWGAAGPGRWVTIFATDTPTPHVFATIAGLRIDTSHAGTDVGPNRDQEGPRWRVFDRIPGWAQWSIRHPPGL